MAEPPLPPGWTSQFDPNHNHWFYIDTRTRHVQWEVPAIAAPLGPPPPQPRVKYDHQPYQRPAAVPLPINERKEGNGKVALLGKIMTKVIGGGEKKSGLGMMGNARRGRERHRVGEEVVYVEDDGERRNSGSGSSRSGSESGADREGEEGEGRGSEDLMESGSGSESSNDDSGSDTESDAASLDWENDFDDGGFDGGE